LLLLVLLLLLLLPALDAWCCVDMDLIKAVELPVKHLVVEARGHLDGLCWVAILHNDQVVWLKERPPLF
jgi:hypothetical protein